jgi:hypothetical protein
MGLSRKGSQGGQHIDLSTVVRLPALEREALCASPEEIEISSFVNEHVEIIPGIGGQLHRDGSPFYCTYLLILPFQYRGNQKDSARNHLIPVFLSFLSYSSANVPRLSKPLAAASFNA